MILKYLAGVVLLLSSSLAQAAGCTLTVADMAFSAYRGNQTTPNDSTAALSLACDNPMQQAETVIYSIQLGPGSNGQRANRAMRSGSDSLLYNLFTDAARTQVWGDGNEGTMVFTGQLALPASRTAQHLVYGRLFERQIVPPGVYGETLQVLLAY